MNFKKRVYFFLMILIFPVVVFSQNYTSYLTGSLMDTMVSPLGGVCLMGGATEDDNAMRWFLQRANGGDILVLRTSGSDGYNNYLYNDLGIPVNSVETIVCHNAFASNEPYLIQKIQQAEGIWFAGGNQWNYINYWRNTAVDSAINQAIKQRNIVIGGTSAGMAIQGQFYFTAQNGTINSTNALNNPYHSSLTLDTISFIQNFYLKNTITDTHFDNPDRKGRLITFLARIYNDYGVPAKAIACDEYTAVCIDTNGIAKVFGGFPNYDDNAYFIQVNCELPNPYPENCTAGNPLTWDYNGLAVKTYQIKGTTYANNSFDIKDWKTGMGGTWFDWSVSNGIFFEQNGNPLNCITTKNSNVKSFECHVFPNPASDFIYIYTSDFECEEIQLCNPLGQLFTSSFKKLNSQTLLVILEPLHSGLYSLILKGKDGKFYQTKVIKE